ncbi:MAG: hypothetical protein B7Z30_10165 [Rhizobiales bacterium 12-68-15]|nr:MAG: hypothetical protein B7Z30_10165 [Rhizobiales bacterium 12-68-15]
MVTYCSSATCAPETAAMRLSAQTPVYSFPARLLHWLSALCILMVIPFGFIMMRVPAGEVQNQLFDLHRSIGFLILCLSVIRVFVRVVKGAPPPASLPRWQVRLSSGVHPGRR